MKKHPAIPVAPLPSTTPRLQLAVLRAAESFTCRRAFTNPTLSHEAFDAPLHFHPEHELLLMESSTGTRYVADSIERYEPGDLVLIGSNVPHVFLRDADPANQTTASSIVVQFRTTFLGEAFLAKPELHDIAKMLTAANHGLHYGRATVKWVAPMLRRMLAVQGARRVALLIEVLGRLAEAPARSLSSGAVKQRVRQEDYERINRIVAYVESNYQNEISMESAAKLVSLSPTSFSRWFSAAAGKPFVQFLTDVRLAHAYHELVETGKSVTEIAFDCGFNSVSHFIHRFHDVRGMSPRQFRRRAAAGQIQP